MEKRIDESRVHEGHRSRMHAKLGAYGQRIFDTYELLEMLLYRVIPYKDTNPVAKALLYSFDGLDGVFCASKEELMTVHGIGEQTADYLLAVGGLSEIIGSEMVPDAAKSPSDFESVGKYLVDYFAGVDQKQVVAMFFDSSMRLIEMQKMYDLEYESGGVKAKAFIDVALKNHAAVIISAHNHPFGPFYPTQGDRATNAVISDALGMASIVHAEHYIISGNHFAGIGSLKSFNAKLSQMPAVSNFLDTREKYDGRVADFVTKEQDDTVSDCAKSVNPSRDYLAKLLSYGTVKSSLVYADELLRKYHTIENTFTAPLRELSAIVGERTALYIKLLTYITSRRKTDGFIFGKRHSSAEIAEYLKALFLGESVEKIYLISLDSNDKVVSCDLLSEGTVNASDVLPRKAIEAAVAASASAVYIAHNHPFGTTNPSSDDINLTKTFDALFNSCGIELREHFIIAGQLCDTVTF